MATQTEVADRVVTEPKYYHNCVTGELEAETPQDAEPDTRGEIVQFFPCPYCDGHGAKVKRADGKPTALLCDHCEGEGCLGATEDDLEAASQIGSDNPFCPHDWSYTGTAYGGDDESYHGEGRVYCGMCGADGDA